MENELFIGLLILLALVFATFVALTFSRRLRRQREASRGMPRRTHATVRAEQNPTVHDRGTQSAEPQPPERKVRPLRPGPDNLERFR